MCAIFAPLSYFILFPNPDIRGVVASLKQDGPAPQEADTPVQETITAVGPLTRAVPIAYYTGFTAAFAAGGSQRVMKKQASYIGWFKKRPSALVLLITRYEDDHGRKAYEIDEGEAMTFVRGYTLPILAFAFCLFLVRKRDAEVSRDKFKRILVRRLLSLLSKRTTAA
jgi:hypothetical protein